MKKPIAALCLIALTLGVVQLPAHAQFISVFNHNDRDHDGRWNRQEFYNANNNYYHHHHNVVVLDNGREFDRLDHDHDGYVTREEVKSYHNW